MDSSGRVPISGRDRDPRMLTQHSQSQQQHFQHQNQSKNTENQLIDYRMTQSSYMGARFIFECGKISGFRLNFALKLINLNERVLMGFIYCLQG